MKLLINWVISALSLYLLSFLFSGIVFDSFTAALITSIILGLINAIIKPILIILTLPINIITLGLFSLIINACMLIIASNVSPGFHVDSFATAFFASIVLSVINAILSSMVKKNKER